MSDGSPNLVCFLLTVLIGNAISWDGDFNVHTEGEVFASVIDLVLNCACFIYIGAWLPFENFHIPELGITPWRLATLCVAILFVRRIPAMFMLYKWIPEIRNWKEALFTGHFGPMGVGAVFVSTLALHKLPSPSYPPETQQDYLALMLQPIVTSVVLGSIIIRASFFLLFYMAFSHQGPPDGLSIPFFNVSRSMKSRTSTLARTLTRPGALLSPPEWINQISAGWTPPSGVQEETAGVGNDRVVTFPTELGRELDLSQDERHSPPLLSPTDSPTVTFLEGGDDVAAGGIDFDTGAATGARLPGRIQKASEDRKVSILIT